MSFTNFTSGCSYFFGGGYLNLMPHERIGLSILTNGVPEVLTASRMQLRKGANFLKMYVGGAVSGLRDPMDLDIVEFSFDAIRPADDEAKRWNTCLAIHTYTDASTRQALEAGPINRDVDSHSPRYKISIRSEARAF